MLYALLFVASVFQPVFGGAPNSVQDSVIYRAHYEHYHIRDTASSGEAHEETMVLLVGEASSLFVSYDKLIQRVANREAATAYFALSPDEEQPPFRPSGRQVVTPQEIVMDHDAQRTVVKDYLGYNYVYEEPYPQIDWQIQGDKKEIAGLPCIRANAFFKGRCWEVWFAPGIPVSFGPWLLHGLPGLIVSARDANAEVGYDLIGFYDNATPDEVFEKEPAYKEIGVTYADNAVTMSREEFVRLREKSFKNPQEFFRAVSRQYLSKAADYGLTNTKSWMVQIENPIDLEIQQ